MPVIDLRNYLGAPAEPPVNPVFDRTRKLVRGSPYEQALAFEQQAADVRSGRGMAALQAMQNQQDQIAQQAQNIRLQQEAQIAAEQATQGLAGLDPMQPDYLGRRQQILQKSPAALLEPQFRNALKVYDNGYNNFAKQQQAVQAQTEAQRKKVNDLAIRAIEFGADPNEIAGYAEAGDIHRIAQAGGAARTSGKTGSKSAADPLRNTYKELFEISKKEIEDIGGLGGEPSLEDKARLDEAKLHRDNYFNYLKGLTPEGKKVATADVPVDTSVAPPAGTSQLKEVFGAETAIAPPEQIKKEIDDHMESGGADENFYAAFIANPSNDLKQKQKALDKFRAIVANPPPLKGATVGESIARKEALKEKLKQAEEDIHFGPELEKYTKAWQESKNDVDRVISRFAKSVGASKEEVINSLAKDEDIAVPQPSGKPIYRKVKDLLSKHWADELGVKGDMWRKKDERLEPFTKSRFADRLGVKPISIPGFPNFGEALALGQQPKFYGDVLDVYIREKAETSPQQTNSPQPSVAKIKSVRQIE